jgi:hypothetical protein
VGRLPISWVPGEGETDFGRVFHGTDAVFMGNVIIGCNYQYYSDYPFEKLQSHFKIYLLLKTSHL